jgi:hypothetical protein
VRERKGAAGAGRGKGGGREGGETGRVGFGSFYIMSSSNPDRWIVRSTATVRWEKVGREGEIVPRKRSGPVVVCRAPRFRPTINIIFFQNCSIWILLVKYSKQTQNCTKF